MKFELQFAVKIEPQSVLACFTHWILPYHRVESGLKGLHRLHTIKFQANCHPLYGKSGLNDYAEAEVAHLNISRLDSTATVAAFQDANLLPFLSFKRVAFLRTYINTITILNESMQTYHGVLESEGYRTNSKVEKLRQLVRNNAANVFAVNKLVQEKLMEYFDESVSDKENMKNTGDDLKLKFYKEKALKGEFSVPYE